MNSTIYYCSYCEARVELKWQVGEDKPPKVCTECGREARNNTPQPRFIREYSNHAVIRGKGDWE